MSDREGYRLIRDFTYFLCDLGVDSYAYYWDDIDSMLDVLYGVLEEESEEEL